MKKRTLWIVLGIILIILVGVYLYASYFFSSVLIDAETRTLAEDIARSDRGSYAEYGLPEPQDVSIDAGDVTLAGWYFNNELDGDCGVLLLHGYTGTRNGVLAICTACSGNAVVICWRMMRVVMVIVAMLTTPTAIMKKTMAKQL